MNKNMPSFVISPKDHDLLFTDDNGKPFPEPLKFVITPKDNATFFEVEEMYCFPQMPG